MRVSKLSGAFFPTLFGVSYGERKALIRMIKVPTEPNREDYAFIGTKQLQHHE